MKPFHLVCLFAVGALAQNKPPSDHGRWLLQSGSLYNKAWGAWYAGGSHDPAMLEVILDKLQAAQNLSDSPRDSEGYAYVQCLFDAAIEIPGPIRVDVIEPFAKSWLPEILILLNRNPTDLANEAALLKMRDRNLPNGEWSAVSDLLFAMSSKPFFQRSLSELKVTHKFVVTDQDFATGGMGSGCGITKNRFPRGYPPVTLYQLTAAPKDAQDAPLIQKPVPVYVIATVIPENGEETNCIFYDGMRAEFRQFRLAQFVSAIGSPSAEAPRTDIFHMQSAIWPPIGDQMATHLDQQATAIRALVVEAQQRGLLEASEVRLTIIPKVEDIRRRRDEPVPPVSPREIVIP